MSTRNEEIDNEEFDLRISKSRLEDYIDTKDKLESTKDWLIDNRLLTLKLQKALSDDLEEIEARVDEYELKVTKYRIRILELKSKWW